MTKTNRIIVSCELTPWTGEDLHCRWCGVELSGRRTAWCSNKCKLTFEKNHIWRFARRAARRRDKYACTTCGSEEKIQVNHINPLDGAGYTISCSHHLENLEVLCHSCHVQVTNRQRAEGLIKTRKTKEPS